jgi:predicted nuclease of predicted toxin-antitoxin system
MLPLASDEDLHGAIVRGLQRRVPDLDLVRVQDVGLGHTPDPSILEWAAGEGRVIITEDVNTMVGHAWDRVRAGLPMAGVIVRGKDLDIGEAIDALELAVTCGAAEDFKDQVKFLPNL